MRSAAEEIEWGALPPASTSESKSKGKTRAKAGNGKGKANLPPPLHGNLAKSVDNYAFANNPMLSDDKRTYEIRFTGEFKD